MSATTNGEEHDLLKRLADDIEHLTGRPEEDLGGLREIQLAGQALMQREQLRLSRKLGESHPRISQIKTRRSEILETVRALDAEKERTKIRVPQVSPKETLIHGRIVDEKQRGILGLQVYLADEQGQIQKEAGDAITDANGYYALKVILDNVPADIRDKLKLTVRTPKNRVVYQEPQPLKIAAGASHVIEVRLQRSQLTRIRVGPQPDGPQIKPWTVHGTVTDARGKPLPGLVVAVFDKARTTDNKLGAAQTAKNGSYEVTYTAKDTKEGPDPGADLYVTVTDSSGKIVYTSEERIIYNPGQTVVFDIRIP